MRAVQSFTVRPSLPPAISALRELAWNLRWTWDSRAQEVFRWLDPDLWESSGHDPVRLLGLIGRDRLEALAADAAFVETLDEVALELRRYLDGETWFSQRQATGETPLRSVGYFSPEFGLAEALPQYSGGLGVLSGDHLKAASGLGIPLTGVGLLYKHAYAHQRLDTDGWQQEHYPTLDPHGMPLTLVDGLRIEVDMAGTTVAAQVWRADVGRVPLYLLDSDLEDNDEAGRVVTDRLYGGDSEHRVRQEILLGIGGVRALETLGALPQVFHLNEGHAGFLSLERIRMLLREGLSYREAVEAVRSSTVFTTHTPVPAGIDLFPRDLMERYFKGWSADAGIDFEELMALGHQPGDDTDAPFNMAVLSLRLAGRANGVAQLHGAVSRRLFSRLWPDVPTDEVPISALTNGVHAKTWVSAPMNELLARRVLSDWPSATEDRWSHVDDALDEELWRVRNLGRERLVDFVRHRLRDTAAARGEIDTMWCEEALDPDALTIVWARRFATYKRATLLLSQPDRLRALLLSRDQPVQFVFAGKAHPADTHGKEFIRAIAQFSRQPDIRHRLVFIEDYDMAVARILLQGADVWLNTPRRPLEACGTSGMKAALNGALNCSILDGWWDEMYDGDNGWAIVSAEGHEDLARRDQAEATSLFELLERQIVPLFFERRGGQIPRAWMAKVKHSLRTLGPRVSAARMVREYTTALYEASAATADAQAADGFRRARELAEWKDRVRRAWGDVGVDAVSSADTVAELGASRSVECTVRLGDLLPGDVDVQVLHGPVGPTGELEATEVAVLDAAGDGRYRGQFACERPGRYGFTVRVVPSHPDLASFAELGLVAWAD